METATVSSVSQAIAALRMIQDRHGDLPMLNEKGGPFQFTTIIWSDEDRKKAGDDLGELPDGVTIDGVGVVEGQAGAMSKLENLYHDVLMQVFAGQALCELLHKDNNDPNYPGLAVIWENIFNNLDKGCDVLGEICLSLGKEVSHG